jgi:6-phosphogluconolactonase
MRTLLALLLLSCSSDDSTLVTTQDGGTPGSTDAQSAVPDGSLPTADASDGATPTVAGDLLMLVGSGDSRIRAFVLDASGAIRSQKDSAANGSPSFLALDAAKRLVFAVNENSGTVRAYALDPNTLALTANGDAVASGGAGPTHIALHPTGSHVMVANYTGGTSGVFPVQADGSLGMASDVKASGAKAHHVTTDPSGNFAFVTCLGTNSTQQYKWAGGVLQANGTVTLPGNPGPRHLAFRPDATFAYGINELDSTVTGYRYDKAMGKLTTLTSMSSLPAGATVQNTGAEIAVHPSGRWVYASNRGHDSIVQFASDGSSGALTLVGHTATGGNTPRSFGVDPAGAWLAVANQNSGSVRVFRLDASGKLVNPLPDVSIPSPIFVGLFRIVR